jgi:hypothetical protein
MNRQIRGVNPRGPYNKNGSEKENKENNKNKEYKKERIKRKKKGSVICLDKIQWI